MRDMLFEVVHIVSLHLNASVLVSGYLYISYSILYGNFL